MYSKSNVKLSSFFLLSESTIYVLYVVNRIIVLNCSNKILDDNIVLEAKV